MSVRKIIGNLGFSQMEWKSLSPPERIKFLFSHIITLQAKNKELKSKIILMRRNYEKNTIRHNKRVAFLEANSNRLKDYIESYSKRQSQRSDS